MHINNHTNPPSIEDMQLGEALKQQNRHGPVPIHKRSGIENGIVTPLHSKTYVQETRIVGISITVRKS